MFAGSGSLGLESISRGAGFSYFYEINYHVLKILKKNCESMSNKNIYKIIKEDSTSLKNFSLIYPLSGIFIDPPYNYIFYEEILINIYKSNILNKNTIIVIELAKNKSFNLPSNFKIIVEKIYGKTKLYFLQLL